MKHADTVFEMIDEPEIVELLQQHVRRVKQNAAARMMAGCFQEAIERRTVVKIFPRMDLVTQIHARLVERIKNGQPALGQFTKSGFNQTRRTLGPGIQIRPEQRATERRVGF